jgi:hypothetical protein
MVRRARTFLLALALAPTLVVARAPRALAADAPTSPWRDPAILEKRLAEACDEVEKETGATFAKRPVVRAASTKDLVEVLIRVDSTLDPSQRSARPIIEILATHLLAYYDAERHAILVSHDNAERMGKEEELPLATEPVLRVLLVHEATHAIDWARHGWEDVRRTRSTGDGMHAFGAVAEGHAQFVAQRIAKRLGLSAAFDTMTAAIVAVPKKDLGIPRSMLDALVAETTFGYVQGHRFIDAVFAAKGLEGVERALASPPTDTRAIERPDRWLSGKDAAAEVDLDLLVEQFRPLVADPAWTVRGDRIRKAALDSQRPRLSPERRAKFLEGYEDGRALVGGGARDGAQVIAMVLRFATEEDARRFVDDDREISARSGPELAALGFELDESTVTDGAGPGGRVRGHAITKRMSGPPGAVRVDGQEGSIGAVVFTVMAVNAPWLDRATIDAAVARFEAAVADPAAARKAEKPPAVPVPKARKVDRDARAVVVRVEAPDGSPVQRYRLVASHERRDWDPQDVVDGVGRLSLSPRNSGTRITIVRALDSGGRPANWAGSHVVGDDESEVTIRLRPGLSVKGRVRKDDGSGLSGVDVVAFVAEERPWVAVAHAHSVTDADGGFELIGLGDQIYRLAVESNAWATVPVVATRGGAVDVDVRVLPAVDVLLRVVDEQGTAVTGANVTLLQESGVGELFGEAVATGPDGTARLPRLAAGSKHRLQVEPPETREDLIAVDLEAWSTSQATVTLPRGFTASGRVVDADGKPVAGAGVVVRHEPADGGTRYLYALADERGAFVFRGLPAVPHHVAAMPKAKDSSIVRTPPVDGWTPVDPAAPGEIELVLPTP